MVSRDAFGYIIFVLNHDKAEMIPLSYDYVSSWEDCQDKLVDFEGNPYRCASAACKISPY